jgi:hypothetical protein
MKSTVKVIKFEYLSTEIHTLDMWLDIRNLYYLLCLSRIYVIANYCVSLRFTVFPSLTIISYSNYVFVTEAGLLSTLLCLATFWEAGLY